MELIENVLDKEIHNNVTEFEFNEKIRIENIKIKKRTREEMEFLYIIKDKMRRNSLNYYSIMEKRIGTKNSRR